MVVNFKVFKKCSPNGKVTLYLGKRDFVDHLSSVEPIGGLESPSPSRTSSNRGSLLQTE